MSGKDAPCQSPEFASEANEIEGTWADCIVQRLTYDWQACNETPQQRQALLEDIRRGIASRALAHLQAGQDSVLVVATPPGTGKSTAVATLGEPGGQYGLNLAWIAERHEMAEQVPTLARFNHIERCTHENCPSGYHTHEALLDRGLPTLWFHQQHAQPCAYLQQFHQHTSAFYQLAHVHTAHPAKHPDGIVIDELNLEAWLEPYEVTRSHILEARGSYGSETPAWRLLTAVCDVMHKATSTEQERSGQTLFAALDTHLGGNLLDILDELGTELDATILYPQPRIPLDAPNAAERLHERPTRVLAHLWHGLTDEMQHYRHGEVAWNSRLRVGPGPGKHTKSDWVLYITTPRTFKVADDAQLPPRIVLDGTADVALLRRLLGNSPIDTLTIHVPEDLSPPPHLRHIAVRLRTRKGGVKRYNKTSFTWEQDAGARERAIAEVQFLLWQLDADGVLRAADKVGLITFQGIEVEMRQRLGITEHVSGHFWGVRGSNRFADCEFLLVVGRPRIPTQQVVRMGNVLYASDKEPLDIEQYKAADGTHHFRDARLEQLDSYLTRAELTQCAHRNRPLIFDHRTVVTFCDEPIAYLPITTEVQRLPSHVARAHESGQDELSDDERLEQASRHLYQRGQKQTVAALLDTLKELFGKGLNRQKVNRWHRAHPQSAPHFPTAA